MEDPKPVDVPLRYPTATIYLDDSGVKAGGSRLLVIGGVKVRQHGALLRSIRHIRDQTGYRGEFKFTGINKGSLAAYYAIIDALQKSDAHLIACVTTRPANAGWRFYSEVTARLVRGNINRRELVSLMMDTISTPEHVAFEDVVRGKVNKDLSATSVISSACLDSRSSDGLQLADLVAGAVGFHRRMVAGESGNPGSIKGRVVSHLMNAFGGIDLMDQRSGRVNIHTWHKKPALDIVQDVTKLAKSG